ncbi:hypothetical protein GC170_08115 [bacterium]|nr:hypothetical protein [bacterium]
MELTYSDHVRRISYLAIAVLSLLAWRVGRAEVLSADGLRYTAQARKIAAGDWRGGLVGSVDHPMYPIQIAAVRTLVGLPDTALGLQDAAWAAAMLHGVLLVIPTYWVARSLFGDSSAWLGTAAFYAVPNTSEILADSLSESTFLHFWCWALGFSLAFLKRGNPAWLIGMAAAGAGAYWTRPEGLLICLALGMTILITPLLRSTRVDWPRLGRVLAILAISTGALSLPVILSRGTIGTKPAIAKVLGLKNRSAAHAVERERPLEPGTTELAIWGDAAAAFYKALRTATTSTGLILAIVGLVLAPRASAAAARRFLLIGVILSLCVLALLRLHATQGYCAPRHTMVPAQLLLMAAGHGVVVLSSRLASNLMRFSFLRERVGLRPVPVIYFALGCAWTTTQAGEFARPIGHSALGYKLAGDWLSQHIPPGESIIDLSGWASFYAERPGYGFAKLHEITPGNPSRYLVVRKAHLVGPWEYCERMRELARDADLVATFPQSVADRTSEVRVYERRTPQVAASGHARSKPGSQAEGQPVDAGSVRQ